jgi:hypothetical protein
MQPSMTRSGNHLSKRLVSMSGPGKPRRWPVWTSAVAFALASLNCGYAATPSRAESEARLRRDVAFLASDALEGRGVTTEGIGKAADYIAAEFHKAGLKPGGVNGTYFQPFTIPGAVLEEPATLSVRRSRGDGRGSDRTLRQGADFWPLGLGRTGVVHSLPAVFAGYGISSKADPAYDDYADLDVADKVVVILRGGWKSLPDGTQRYRLVTLDAKLSLAEQHHAAALIVVNDAANAAGGDDLLDFKYTARAWRAGGIPVLHARRSVLETMLPGGAEELRRIERDAELTKKPQGRALGDWEVSLGVKMKRGNIALKNVIGVLDGCGPLADETVIVGAHYDHLGYGGVIDTKMAIHPGADDNASGTSALMELARRLAGDPPAGARRRLVFTAFSAEEIGLLGSADYTKHPAFPLEKTAAMVNFDMVGRLRLDEETKQDMLLVDGTGTAPTFDALLEDVNKKYGFRLVKKPSGLGPSDQESFYLKRVPVIFCHTGHHADWHRPSDTADKINVAGMRKVTDFAEETIARLATVGRKPEYARVSGGDGPSYASPVPHLGIQPSYSDAEVDKGVLLERVLEGGPAAKAGLKAGDRIVEVSGQPVKNMASYMTVMSARKKTGDFDLVILRGDKRLPIKVHID